MAKKGIWNDAHDISIYNFPVEVYVENEGESHTASGLYSILNDEWIVVPKKKEVMIDKDDITTKAEEFIYPNLKMFKNFTMMENTKK